LQQRKKPGAPFEVEFAHDVIEEEEGGSPVEAGEVFRLGHLE